ncbi:hypothetical protein BDY21DRAFT_348604 [Lineolata rhizophorae]|uniref:Uncharacterized protein n=1 Tax=Lineolata rhizophorae TaxID=578093 RepID=A0A6A6NWB7_9PEZI|nr:hypothetical protein BDY21DRAFT_348604 [Lineolata rhizophorae]
MRVITADGVALVAMELAESMMQPEPECGRGSAAVGTCETRRRRPQKRKAGSRNPSRPPFLAELQHRAFYKPRSAGNWLVGTCRTDSAPRPRARRARLAPLQRELSFRERLWRIAALQTRLTPSGPRPSRTVRSGTAGSGPDSRAASVFCHGYLIQLRRDT